MVKITYGMNVINCERIITHQLNSIYSHADEIIIIEGAYKKFEKFAPKATSTDMTVEKIKAYPDPKNKIRLYTNNIFFEDRAEMCSKIVEHAKCDILFQVDVDEFYHDDTHKFIRKLFNSDKRLDQVRFMFIDFFFRPDLCVLGIEEKGLNDVRRVFRLKNATCFINQRPPTLGAGSRQVFSRKVISGEYLSRMGHIMYHATAISIQQIREKNNYYKKMWGINNSRYDFFSIKGIDMLNVHGIPRYFTPVCKTDIKIPKAMKPIFKAVDKKLSKEILTLVEDPKYASLVTCALDIIKINKKNYLFDIPKNLVSLFKIPKARLWQFLIVQLFCIIRRIRQWVL